MKEIETGSKMNPVQENQPCLCGQVVLEARDIVKRFPGVLALDHVNFKAYAGKVHALVGENGAGKSTLMKILSGVITDYEGSLFIDGQTVHFRDTAEAQDCGVAIVHQELNLIPYLSIAENIFLGREPMKALGILDSKKMYRDTEIILSDLHFKHSAHTLVSDLRVGQQQVIEISKALSLHPRVLIMDEPSSSLSDKEVRRLFGLIENLKKQNVAIIYISHKMDEIQEIADVVTVLRDGKFITEKPMTSTSMDEIVRAMVGRDLGDFFVRQEHEIGDTVLDVKHLYLKKKRGPQSFLLEDIHLTLHKGEILGLYGLMGAGRTELLETLMGLYPDCTEGEIWLDGQKETITHPQEAISKGMALIPEDRKEQGLVMDMSIIHNTTLSSLKRFTRFGWLDFNKESRETAACRDKFQLKAYSGHQLVSQLSGGNQQKVVISKSMLTQPKILLLDEPTRGIDIHAKNEIYHWMNVWAEEGMALIVVSSELPEIMAVSDRIATLCQGKLTTVFERSEFSEEAILSASLPVEKNLR